MGREGAKKRLAEIKARWIKELPEAMSVLDEGSRPLRSSTRFPRRTGRA